MQEPGLARVALRTSSKKDFESYSFIEFPMYVANCPLKRWKVSSNGSFSFESCLDDMFVFPVPKMLYVRIPVDVNGLFAAYDSLSLSL